MVNMIGIRTIIFYILFITVFSGLYAQAPELRTVMPNSWQKLTRLTPEQEAAFFRENQNISNGIITQWRRADGSFTINSNNISKITGVYREQAGADIFYRLITANSETPDFTKQEEIMFLQTLLYEYKGRKVILAYGRYNYVNAGETSSFTVYNSLDIIRSGESAKGILFTYMGYSFKFIDGKRTFTSMEKGQLAGHNNSYYILIKNIVNALDKNPNVSAEISITGYNFGDAPRIQIEASPCLVDPNIPLRYSLQNAFDGDPSTSYVENTEDDLMYVQIYVKTDIIQRFAVINGYAQNMTLYKNNNRIKTVANFVPTTLDDNELGYQIIDLPNQAFVVNDIYRGDRYNDTCLAELNMYTTEHGWLFGEIDD